MTEICPFCQLLTLADLLDHLEEADRRDRAEARQEAEGRVPADHVAHLEELATRRPYDLALHKELAGTYLQNGEPEKALDLLEDLHHRHPKDEAVHWLVLDALFADGGDETAFPWHDEIPIVVHLDEDTVDACCELLHRSPPRDLEALYLELLRCGYCAFNEDDLLDALRRDGRFRIEGDGRVGWPRVGLV